MIDLEKLINDEFEHLYPRLPATENWEDVLGRADSTLETARPADGAERLGPRRSRVATAARRRPLLALLGLVAVAAIPVSALAIQSGNPWWFLPSNPSKSAPGIGLAKGSNVVIVKRGSWDGHGWILTAYRTSDNDLCFQLTPTKNNQPTKQGGGVEGCGPMLGMTPIRGKQRPLTITFLSSYGGPANSKAQLPGYIVGPVIGTATTVRVRLDDGTIVHTSTFGSPSGLGADIRFYATPIPSAPQVNSSSCRQQALAQARVMPVSIVGLGSSGKTVATFSRTPLAVKRFALLRCKPPTGQLVPGNAPAAATAGMKPVERITGPYGAVANLAIGTTVPITYEQPEASGGIKPITVASRCWRVSFSDGQRQGACSRQVKLNNPQYFLDYREVEYVGHDVFVVLHAAARTGPPVTTITLRLAPGKVLSARPHNGVVIFAIPRADITAKGQRHMLIGYDHRHRELSQVEYIFYRACPDSAAAGTTC